MELYNECLRILNAEVELLGRLYALQETVHEAVLRRNWTDFENANENLSQMGALLNSLEEKRALLFEGQKIAEFAARFESGQKNALLAEHRKLKSISTKIQASAGAFNEYVNGMNLIVHNFLDAVFPQRRGKLYSRAGAVKTNDIRSVVLNRVF